METKKNKCVKDQAERTLPGAAVDTADDGKTTKHEVEERTDILDNNPSSAPLFNESDTPAPL